MSINSYEVFVHVRLQNSAYADPSLIATASGATAVLDEIVVNGRESDLRDYGPAELTAIKAAVKQAVVDFLDIPIATPAGPTGGTGNGTISAISVGRGVAVNEVWTITSTSASAFTVSGSVTGSYAPGFTLGSTTVGASSTFTHPTVDAKGRSILQFTLTVGSTAFNTTAPTVFTVTVTAQ